MKRLLIILLCLPLIFACTKEEPFVEGEEIVLDMSVCADGIQTIATRAMGDSVIGDPVLWLVVFDGEGMLVEWTKASIVGSKKDGDKKVMVTSFTASLHATSDKRIIHFLLNYVGVGEDLDLTFGHENNVIGALTVGPNHGVYWQRVELPDGINSTNTASNYLNKVPLLRNFSKITVSVDAATCQGFSLSDFYVLNVPKYGTVAPFQNGNFIDYCIYDGDKRPPFNGAHFDAKDYETLDVDEGYRGTMPNNSERINKASEFVEPTDDPESPKTSYFLYENTYVSGDNTRAVFVLLKGTYSGKTYWYRVDLLKQNTSTSMMEYFDILRNFSYNITITNITEGKATAQEAINNPAGNNVLSSLDIAHLTDISDGIATLEVNHTDTVLISRDEVYVRYKFTDTGAPSVNNDNIKANGNGYGWYLTYKGKTYNGNNDILPINVEFEDNNETGGQYAGWRTITISVGADALREREVVSLTLFAKSSNGPMLSRTVDYTLLPKQKMLVECPSKVPEVVGSPVDVSILIPDKLPEAMFPLDFAIEAQGTDQSGTEKNYLAQHISPHKNEVMTVRTAGSIVDNDALRGKKSFQYMVSFSYEDYLNATLTTRQLGGQNVPVRVFTKKFVTNTATSASRVYAYNKYFDLGSDNFVNGKSGDFVAFFSNDNTVQYGVGRTIKLNIVAGNAGTYKVESTTLQVPTRAVLAELTLAADEERTIDLVTSTFADRGQVTVTCGNETRTVTAAERNTLNIKATSVKQGGLDLDGEQQLNVSESEDDALSGEGSASVTITNLKNRTTIKVPDIESEDDMLYFSYINENKVYIASATAGDLNDGTAALEFEEREIVVSITDLALSGSQYYGKDRDVTLTFNTNIAGTYTITYKEGNTTYTIKDIDGSVGANTVKFKTKTWSNQFTNVIVSTTIGGKTYSSNAINGGNRNVIDFGVLTMKRWGNEIGSIAQVNIKSSWNGNTIKTVSYSELKSGNYTLELNNVAEGASLYFTYSNNTKSATVKNIMTGTSIDF